MARYQQDYMGIPAHIREGGEMDPNFRGGYRGMRMRGGENQAAYGRYRFRHAGDLGGAGGFEGIYDRGGRPRLGGYDRDWESGGVYHPREGRRFLRSFNANSPAFDDYEGREPQRSRGYDRGFDRAERDRGSRGGAGAQPRRDPGYANRGLNESGFSEGWVKRRPG